MEVGDIITIRQPINLNRERSEWEKYKEERIPVKARVEKIFDRFFLVSVLSYENKPLYKTCYFDSDFYKGE